MLKPIKLAELISSDVRFADELRRVCTAARVAVPDSATTRQLDKLILKGKLKQANFPYLRSCLAFATLRDRWEGQGDLEPPPTVNPIVLATVSESTVDVKRFRDRMAAQEEQILKPLYGNSSKRNFAPHQKTLRSIRAWLERQTTVACGGSAPHARRGVLPVPALVQGLTLAMLAQPSEHIFFRNPGPIRPRAMLLLSNLAALGVGLQLISSGLPWVDARFEIDRTGTWLKRFVEDTMREVYAQGCTDAAWRTGYEKAIFVANFLNGNDAQDIERVQKVVAEHYGIEVEALRGAPSSGEVAAARVVGSFVASLIVDASNRDICAAFGRDGYNVNAPRHSLKRDVRVLDRKLAPLKEQRWQVMGTHWTSASVSASESSRAMK
jgi:hypothetical protein